MTTRRTSALSAAIVAVPLLLVALVGCSNPTAQTQKSSPSASSSVEDYELAFADCMRGQGVDMPDPDDTDSSVAANNDPAFGAAVQACITELGPGPGGSGTTTTDEQFQSDLLLAACLRENGIEVPDPKPGEAISLPMDSARDILQKCADEAQTGGN
ncbi:hypothetical protein B7R21_16845 [Subtercola boreus]|uniref:Secreted protein n=1 Tax=Subtercola boreus TaxID=120213 RepID=A0A3E0VBC1_9MICO|nr:hypothetical protein [Subtercola boreus]RFA07124.1 hypothetical protein B7R21_16845 [Subtercola boreus]